MKGVQALTGEYEFGGGNTLLDIRERLVQLLVVRDAPETVEDVAYRALELLWRRVWPGQPRVEAVRERQRVLGVHVAAVHDPRDELEVLPALDRHIDLLCQAVLDIHVARLQLAYPV